MTRYAAPPLTRPRIFLGLIPKGYRGTQATVAHVAALIKAGAKDFYVRQQAIDILLGQRVAPKDYLGEIRALFEWVRANVRYTRDPFRLELLHSARRMLELAAGDCDDMTILLGALLEAVGHPVRLVVVGPSSRRPRLFTHIHLEVRHQDRWIPLDPTMPHPMGWAPRTPVRQVISLDEATTGAHPGPAARTDRHRDGDWFHPSRVRRVWARRGTRSHVVDIGSLRGLIYRSDLGRPGRPRTYIHAMEDPPRLVSNVAGTQLHIVGGRYRVTRRGIEG